MKLFLYIVWNFSGVLHNQFVEKSLTEIPDMNYHKLTQVSNKYRSHCGKTPISCGPLLLQDNTRKQKTIQAKHWFHTLNFDVLRHSSYDYDMASYNLHLFLSLRHFMAEIFFIYVEEGKIYL